MPARQLCTFYLDGSLFGVDVTRVQEVIRAQPRTRVPLASPMFAGLINLRGQIVTAIELRERFSMPPRDEATPPMNVVVRGEAGAVSLLVDEVHDVIDVDDETFEPVPATVAADVRGALLGVHKLDRQILLVLDPDRIVGAGAESGRTAA